MGSLRTDRARKKRLQELCARDPNITEALRAYVQTVQNQGLQSFLLDGVGSDRVIYHDRQKRELCRAMKAALVAGGKREPSARIMAQKIFAGVFTGTEQVLQAQRGLYDLQAQLRDLQRQIDHKAGIRENPMVNVFGIKG